MIKNLPNSFVYIVSVTAILTGCVSFPKDRDYFTCDLKPRTLQQSPATDIRPISSKIREPSIISDLEYCTTTDEIFTVMALSGGGPDGAFGAAFIRTIIEKNHDDVKKGGKIKKLHPCLITGVSTGAVMGPYVYLATSDNPIRSEFGLNMLKTLYPNMKDDSLVDKHSWADVPFEPSLYGVDGIENLLKNDVNYDLLRMFLDEYRESRRHFAVGATDILTGNFDIIDLTEYAKDHENQLNKENILACYRSSIQASAAIPIMFPPVAIKVDVNNERITKYYVDGGIRHMMFIDEALFKAVTQNYSKPFEVYGVVNNTFDMSSMKRKLTIQDAAIQNMKVVTDQLYMDTAFAVDAKVRLMKGGMFWATMLDNKDAKDCTKELGAHLFSPGYQRCLDKVGVEAAAQRWSSTPWRYQVIK